MFCCIVHAVVTDYAVLCKLKLPSCCPFTGLSLILPTLLLTLPYSIISSLLVEQQHVAQSHLPTKYKFLVIVNDFNILTAVI